MHPNAESKQVQNVARGMHVRIRGNAASERESEEARTRERETKKEQQRQMRFLVTLAERPGARWDTADG